jgi:hypothetical protein
MNSACTHNKNCTSVCTERENERDFYYFSISGVAWGRLMWKQKWYAGGQGPPQGLQLIHVKAMLVVQGANPPETGALRNVFSNSPIHNVNDRHSGLGHRNFLQLKKYVNLILLLFFPY